MSEETERRDKYEGLHESLAELPTYALRRLASLEERSAELVPIYHEELKKRAKNSR